METITKPRVISSYLKLSDSIKEQIKLTYPRGFSDNLITFTNKEGQKVKGLRFESDEKIYLVKMTEMQAMSIVEDDDDFDEDGNLVESIKEEYEEKYPDLEDSEY